MSIIVGYDKATLREQIDEQAANARLEQLAGMRDTMSLSEKVGLLRMTGRLDEAWTTANEVVRLVRFTGDRSQLVLARLRRAQVLQFQGKLEAALIDFNDCVAEAHLHEWVSEEAFALQHRGKVLFDLQRYTEAARDFRDALTIRVRIHSSPEHIDSSMIAIAVAESFIDSEPT
jgi:tetratricopeptide (TPR) repeat protein